HAVNISRWIDYLKSDHPAFAQALCMSAVAISLVVVFSITPMDIEESFKTFKNDPPKINLSTDTKTFVIEEHKKAVKEIKDRDQEADNWFHNKFILVGGLLAATLGYI